MDLWRKSVLLAEGTARAKALKWVLPCHVLGQVSENLACGPNLARKLFWYIKLWAHSHAHCLHIMHGFVCMTAPELSSCNRNIMVFKTVTIYSLKNFTKQVCQPLLKRPVLEWREQITKFYFFFLCEGRD